ncbi:sulfotransferase family protein [Sphingorhabdus lacus]|jgi:Sulfotransferase family|uniref:Sulfotransferase n=1 Tax=Sphingorhabdus lacus TaxID=392610 RepID=A0A6I6LAT3_9SPHN|nr:sulfotransferase [Sphingorhabdus lacus]QGY81521.1 sulfotransferase [Sphingorhabdus lacus]
MSQAYPGQADWHPSFIIIGAVKAATTWALEQLQVNPALYMPDPEPHYFSSEFDRGEDYYRAYFEAQVGSGRMLGEKSADYLAHPDAPQRIANMLPHARLVVQFRNPVERAYSDYKMLYRRGTVKEGPEAYLASLDNPQPRFLNDGLYAQHMRRWLDHFPTDQIHAFLYDDVKAQPKATVEAISHHIGVDPVFDIGQSRKKANNASERFLPLPVRKVLAPLKSTIAPLRGHPLFESTRGFFAREIAYPPLSPQLRLRLRDFYAEDVEQLGKLLGRDLSAWLRDEPRDAQNSRGEREHSKVA